MGILTLSLKAQKTTDTLSLEKAMQIALRNHSIDSQDSALISEVETTLLSDVVLKYNELQYNTECLNSIIRTKSIVTNSLNDYAHYVVDKQDYNLNIQTIMVDLEIQKLEYEHKINTAKAEFSALLGLDEQDFILSTPFESIYVASDFCLNDIEDQTTLKRDIDQYEHHVSLLQQMSIKRDLSKYQLNTALKSFDHNYSELHHKINNYIEIQFGVLTRMKEIKTLYMAMTKTLASKRLGILD